MSDGTAGRVVFTTTAAEAGQRLDRVLNERLPDLSRNQIQKGFENAAVLVDGKARPKSFRLQAGQEIVFTPPEIATIDLAPEAIPLVVVHEDEDILVVDKPAGMVVHPAPGHGGGTLVNALLHHTGRLAETGDPLRPGIVHRLDQDTSGLLVVALSLRAQASLARQLQDRTMGRTYVALSWGTWPEPLEPLAGDIGRHPRDRQRMAVVRRGGRPAVTHVEVVDDLDFAQLCRVRLETGRTHQIRVHFAHFGHPVVGDPVYGDDRRARNVRPVEQGAAQRLVRHLKRQFLHAQALELVHPASGEALRFTAPLPGELAGPLQRLRRDLGRSPGDPRTGLPDD